MAASLRRRRWRWRGLRWQWRPRSIRDQVTLGVLRLSCANRFRSASAGPSLPLSPNPQCPMRRRAHCGGGPTLVACASASVGVAQALECYCCSFRGAFPRSYPVLLGLVRCSVHRSETLVSPKVGQCRFATAARCAMRVADARGALPRVSLVLLGLLRCSAHRSGTRVSYEG